MTTHGITLTAVRTDHNPNMPEFEGDHWVCTLKRGKREMSLVFSMGYGHNGKAPTCEDVLECLVADATVDGQTFEDWCADLGFDEDSRKAERDYHQIVRQTAKFKRFVGEKLFNQLVYGEEED